MISSFVLKRSLLFLLPVIGTFFLYSLPSTGFDYDHYQEAYENAYYLNEFPWFYTKATITAEPFYLWYNSFIGVIFPYGFPFFLSLNFLACYIISIRFFKKTKTPNTNLIFFWLFLFPVIFPTIFYFSPRSSISFFLILLGFILLCEKHHIKAVLIIFLGSMIHSQYLLLSLFLIATYNTVIHTKRLSSSMRKKVIWLITLVSLVFLLNITSFLSLLESTLSILPSSSVATSKLHYLSDSRSGIRFTSILSIFIYPILTTYIYIRKTKTKKVIFFKDSNHDELFIYLILGVVFLGAAINIAFFDSPHLAGRLSRFSDYIGMSIALPIALAYFNKKLIPFSLLFLTLSSPFLYPTVYGLI